LFENEIFYFSVALICLLLLLFSVFFYLILKKLIENKKAIILERYKEDYQLVLFRYIKEEDAEEPVSYDASLQVRALIDLMAEYKNMLGSEEVHGRITRFAEKHFTSYIRSQLTSRRWSMRMNALYWIEDFNMKSLDLELDQLYSSGKLTKSEEIQFIKIAILQGDRAILEKMINPKHMWTEFDYSLLFQALNHDQLQMLVSAFEELPSGIKYALIDSIGIHQLSEYGGFLESLASHQSAEMRIRSLKAMVEMEHYLSVSDLARHLSSESWQQRLMAVKACEYIRSPELIPLLEKLMGDSSFYVRSRAAQALLRLEKGRVVLKAIAAAKEDTFASDMAEQWLERGAAGWS
jgi:hypothetical protein